MRLLHSSHPAHLRGALALALIGLLFCSATAGSQDATSPAEETVNIPWVLDFAKAKEQAKGEGKDLMINFTGSDWCGWCKRLEGEVFSKKEFIDEAAKKYVLVYLDFPMNEEAKAKVVDEKLNEELRTSYGVQGFPTIILTDQGGNPFGRTGYQPGGPTAYNEHLGKLQGDGAKVKELIAAGDAVSDEQLSAAFPFLMSQELISYSGYSHLLDQAEKIPALSKEVAAFRNNQKLNSMLSQPEPDWDQVHAFLDTEGLSGPDFLNACWATATMYLAEKHQFLAAIKLLEKMLQDPILKDNAQGQKMINEKIAEMQEAEKNHDDDHDHDHDGHDHDGDDHDGHDHDGDDHDG